MRPLETHLELSSHIWMYNRLKEMLVREGILAEDADEDQLRQAVENWLDMIAAVKNRDAVH